MKKMLFSISIAAALFITVNSCKHEPVVVVNPDPVPGPVPNNGVCFESEILPLLKSNCAKSGCHDAGTAEDGYVFETYVTIMRKGVTAGNAGSSKLYKVLFETGSDKMPPAPNPDLTAAQKALIGKWINEGAKNTVNCNTNCDSATFTYSAAIAPLMSTYCTGCHAGAAAQGGGIDLSTYTAVKTYATNGKLVGAVSHTAGFSAMPKSGGKLTDCQITQIKKWVAAGALNN